MPDKQPVEITDEVKHAHVVNAADARAQASEGQYSFLRSEFRRAKPTAEHPEGEVFEIPHKDLLDNDQQERWEDLQDDLLHKYQREPDVYTPDGKTLIAKGALVVPHRDKDGNRLPPWPYRLAIVLWGEDGAKRAKEGGILLSEIEVIWAKQDQEMKERLASDPKSAGSGSGVATASH
ncbi:hypothetical protein [Mycobacterium palustre]|uniref:Tail assembly chaperone n=1 Tax=Mycobacterium palustre TaxID=153971 RepID=A0A1X1ZC68_9MYCO|nr:hypothetical protein [Mycobacterium palustre]MCV7100084.1 hypothetical protein [Mycobacterium palustre]ORW20908.1 hypothetical protein AWC19_14160 [Mycobacterium palustre]